MMKKPGIALLFIVAFLIPNFVFQRQAEAAPIAVSKSQPHGAHIVISLGKKWAKKKVTIDFSYVKVAKTKRTVVSTLGRTLTDKSGKAYLCKTRTLPKKSTVRVRYGSKIIAKRYFAKGLIMPGCNSQANQSATPTSSTTTTSTSTTIPQTASPSSLALAQISDTGSSNSDRITNASTLRFIGNAPSGSSVQILMNGQNAGSPCTADSSGDFACDISGVSEGVHSVTSVSTLNGLQSNQSSAIQVTVDRTAPTAAITPSRSDIGANATFTATVNSSESVTGLTIASIDIWCTGTCSTSQLTGTGTSYQFSMTVSNLSQDIAFFFYGGEFSDIAGNPNTEYYLQAVGYDRLGPVFSAGVVSGKIRLTFNEAPSGFTLTDLALVRESYDCTFFTGRTVVNGYLSNLQMVNSNPLLWEIDMVSTLVNEWQFQPNYYKLIINGSYSDEWGNVSSSSMHQEDQDISDWSAHC